MTMTDDELQVGDEPIEEQDDQKALVDAIRAKRKEISENRETYLSVPGYEEIGLVVRYHLLDAKELNGIGDRVKKQTRDRVDRGMFAAADTLIAACDGLYIDKGNGEFVAFDPDKRGTPLRYERELAEFIGADETVTRARQVVFELFGYNDAALANHCAKLQRWFTNTTRDADEEFLGEA
jgi:hypothetical protein